VRWQDFDRAAPELARDARGVLTKWRFVFLGTVRRDGTPRISPVEAHLVAGDLMLVMVGHSQKAKDVARDPRVTLQSPVVDPADPGVELKVRGRLVEVDDESREATAAAVFEASGWRPLPSWRFVAVDLAAVALVAWEEGVMALTRWSAEDGVLPTERRRLDAEASEYRRVTAE
jgi:hypothetical protein